MKKIFLLVLPFFLLIGLAFADEADFGGSFTFELRAPTNDVFWGHSIPSGFADVNAAFDFTVDDNNIVHTEIGGVSGEEVKVKDAYLKTEWGFMTTKIGDTSYDSMGYAISSKEYELQTKDMSGPGGSVEIPINAFTLSGAKSFDPCSGGFGLKYSKGIVDGLSVSYFVDIKESGENLHALTGALKIVAGDFSAGAGIKSDDGVSSYGIGAKYSFAPTWIAAGFGVTEGEVKMGADTGLDYEIWGAKVALSYIEEIDALNIEAWRKIGAVKITGGYDYNVAADDEVFVKVTADF